MLYGIALREVEGERGLTRSDVLDLFDMLGGEEVFPLELEAREHECSAMGFISAEAAYALDYDYEYSGLHDFIAGVLDDMRNESEDCTYEFKGVKIWLSR